ncbi:hypothetical protein CEP54_004848 [Fusarium duplospermum]|uniref:Uncharacterized protein n=1 Tax=Fusarium duplospermum TaxID=1325734 RepID=A0A428QFM9_9HYPO|nr:hypothetical protein CEP54_004848 [Fusarium duplospermum]
MSTSKSMGTITHRMICTKRNQQHHHVSKGEKQKECVIWELIWESNPGLPDAARMATENFTTKPITPCCGC